MDKAPVDQILVGDCVEVMNEFPEKCADIIFADPPYNLQLQGELRRPDMSRVDAVDDEWDKFDSFADYDQFTRSWLAAARRVLSDEGTIWVIGSYHNIYRVGAIMMDLGFWILNDIVWIKQNPMPQMRGVRFCNAHETIIWAKKSEAQSRYTFHYRALKSGNEDKQMRSDWTIPLCTGGERLAIDGKKVHTTQKPEALLHRILTASSNPGDLALDPFCGTGTTAAVAKKLGRRYITIDRDAGYVEAARKRVSAIRLSAADIEQESVHVDAPPRRTPFISMVETGKLPAGTVLRLRSTDITAAVQADGTIVCGGYRGSIHKIGARCLGFPSCNGWTYWLYKDAITGKEQLIDELRDHQGI